MKDLDTMLLNIISNAATSICTVVEAAELVENFDYLAKRESVKEGIHNKIVLEHVYLFFRAEVKEISKILDHWMDIGNKQNEHRYYYPLTHPALSGKALFERSLVSRLDYAHKGLEMLFFIKSTLPEKAQCNYEYNTLKKRIETHIKDDLYSNWKTEYVVPLGKNNEKENLELKFDKPVITAIRKDSRRTDDMRKRAAKSLVCNFDKYLQGLYAEVKYWGKLQYSEISIISPIMKIYKERNDKRILRENVMLAVRDYNLIMQRLRDDERKLFAQHLSELDQKITNHIDKYKWNSVQNQKFNNTMKDWRIYCEAVYNLVENYKKSVSIIEVQLRFIEDTVMIEIDKSKAHPFSDFVRKQEEVIMKYKSNFKNSFEIVRKAVIDIYNPEFLYADKDIQKEFNLVVLNKYDSLLLDKLKKTVSRSLQEFLTALGTDEKDDTCQFIKIERDLVLEDQGIDVSFSPKIEELHEEFEKIFKNIKSTAAGVWRLSKKFREAREDMVIDAEKKRRLEEEKMKAGKGAEMRGTVLEIGDRNDGKPCPFPDIDPKNPVSKLPVTYEEILSQDNDILGKIKKAIEPIKQTMDTLKSNFKTHSRKCEKPLTDEAKVIAYHSKTTRKGEISGKFWERVYNDLMEDGIKRSIEILDSKTSNTKRQFVEFDSGKLREKLSELKISVKNVRLKIIYDTEVAAMRELLHVKFVDIIKKLNQQPSTPDELRAINAIKDEINVEEMKEEMESIQKAFIALKGQDYAIPSADQQDEARLPTEFEKFRLNLIEAKLEIEKNTKMLKDIMIHDLEVFTAELDLLKSDYDKQAPKSLEKYDVASAKRIINEYKEKVHEKEIAKENHKNGINLFHLDFPPYKPITILNTELEYQTQFWSLKERWDEESAKLDIIQFRKLDIRAMTDQVLGFMDDLDRLPADIKDWPAYTSLNKEMILIRDILPLIEEISHKAMKDRKSVV